MAVLPCRVKLLTERPTTHSEASTRQAQMQIVALFFVIIASVMVYPAWAEDSQINVHDLGAKVMERQTTPWRFRKLWIKLVKKEESSWFHQGSIA